MVQPKSVKLRISDKAEKTLLTDNAAQAPLAAVDWSSQKPAAALNPGACPNN